MPCPGKTVADPGLSPSFTENDRSGTTVGRAGAGAKKVPARVVEKNDGLSNSIENNNPYLVFVVPFLKLLK